MSWRRPVVSTTIGVEGLDVVPGHHVLVGDAPESFAAQVARLMTDPALGTRLATRACNLVRSAHSLDAAATALFAADAS